MDGRTGVRDDDDRGGLSSRRYGEVREQQWGWRFGVCLAAAACSSGCFYGYDTEQSVTLVGDARYPPTTAVTLYFRQPTAADDCTPLAMLEVAGRRFEDTAALMPKLEHDAMGVGANAVFSVNATQTSRSQGDALGELLDSKNKPTVYSSHLLTGLAARCHAPNAAPPEGAVGYRFGQRPSDVEAECTSQGRRYSASPATAACDGTPAAVGFPASASFKYCDGALCKIDVTGALDAHTAIAWQAEFDRLEGRLARRYGMPSGERIDIPRNCLGDALLGCLATKQASHEYEWRFGNRASVWLIATGSDASPAVRIVYGRPPPPAVTRPPAL